MDHTKHKQASASHCHTMNQDGHEGHSHGATYFLNKKITWFINIYFFFMATAYLIIKLLNPQNELKYFLHPAIWITLSTILIFTNGLKYFKVYKELVKDKIFSVNLLMAIAAHTMYIFSVVSSIIGLVNQKSFPKIHAMWAAIFYIITLMDMGHAIEGKLNKSSKKGFDKLKQLVAQTAYVQDGTKIIEKQINAIKAGDVIVVKQGKTVPLDGVLMSKIGVFDNSNITGEGEYVSLKKGKYVISGAINHDRDVTIKVTKIFNDSTIKRIVDKVQTSSSKITNQQHIINKLVKFLIPLVFFISIVTMIAWFVIIAMKPNISLPWASNLDKTHAPFSAFFTVLDIAAPCALGMAIPLITMVSSFIGGTNSIVFNSTKKIEDINKAKIIAFDKTGTLTEDRFSLVNVIGDKKYLPIVKALEKDNSHPIAKSIFEAITAKPVQISNKKNIAGKGVSAKYCGKKIIIQKTIDTKHLQSDNTLVSLYEDGKVKLTFELAPKIKDNAKAIVQYLKDKGLKVVMITGDNKKAATKIAHAIGIKEFYAEASPEEKLQIVNQLKKEGKLIYIGDGFNDLIAARNADVSIGFASGDHILNDLTDISLITNNLRALKKLFNLSRMHLAATKISIMSVFAFSFALIPFAMVLVIPPFMGAIIMIIVDVWVVFCSFMYKVIGMKRI